MDKNRSDKDGFYVYKAVKMITEAYKLLRTEFEKCIQLVDKNEDYEAYAREKYRHSLQVMGAGNYLIKHIAWLQNKSPEFIELVKTAILLHDTARFQEIALLQQGYKNFDHGIAGSILLQSTNLFNDVRIWLPIKHHGHLIKDLYSDVEYQNIEDKSLQDDVRRICFIIRDADKIANLHMIVHEPKMRWLFWGKKHIDLSVDGKISDMTEKYAFGSTTIPRNFKATPADCIVSFLSWYKDINYQCAIDFCSILSITTGMLQILDEYCIDEAFKQKFTAHLNSYLQGRQFFN